MGSSSKKVVVGHKYYLGFHMVLCHTLDHGEIKEIWAGERIAWSGSVMSSSSLYISKSKLFGGERKEGGIKGTVDIAFGENSQTKNSYLTGQLGSDIPAFRGVLSFIGRQLYVAAGSPYMKPWWIRVKGIPGYSWYSAKADISGSANPAHMIRECLTNEHWGLGEDVSKIDDANFQGVADTLYSEGLGLSMLLASQDRISEFIQEILRHIGGVIYEDQITGKYKIKLLRGDYSIPSLPVFDESNIISVNSYDKPSPAEILDEIIIKYRPKGKPKDAAAAFQNLATAESQGGIISQTVNYPGIDTHANAARIAARELRRQSAKLSKVKLTVNRDAYDLTLGGVFKFSWSALEIDQLIMRINSISYGTIENPNITIDAIEDVFALSEATYLQPEETSWSDPLSDPVAISNRQILEANWWDLTRVIDQANLNLVASDSSYINYLGLIPSVASTGYELWTKPAGGEYAYQDYAQYLPEALLVNDITPDETTDIQISGLEEAEADDIRIGQYAVIDDEYVRIDSVNVTSGLIMIGRGCNDTVPAEHSSGTRVWFAEEDMGRDLTEYSDGETIYAKALVETGLGLLDISSAVEDSIVVDRRQYKPYPPGQFKFNSEYYPEAIVGALTISWAHRDRLQQTATIIDHTAASIGPETNVTYTLQLYGQLGTLLKTYTGLTGTSQVWTTEASDSGIPSNPIVYQNPIDDVGTGWNGMTMRSIVPASYITGDATNIIIKVEAPDTGGMTISKMYVGHQAAAGDPYDFDGSQVQVTFDTGNPNKTLSAGESVWSDSLSFTLDQTKNLIFAVYFGTTNASHGEGLTGGARYYKSGDDVATTDASGYSGGITDRSYVVSAVADDQGLVGFALNDEVRAVLTAVRDGIDSHQSCDWTVKRAGYGYNYGMYYGGI